MKKMLRLLHLRFKAPLSSHLNSSMATAAAAAAAVIDPSSSLTIHFLKNSCGLSPEAALSVARKLRIKTTKNPHAVLSLLKSYHFEPSHISRIVSRHPKLLLSDPDRTLRPKLDFFESVGFAGPALVSLVSSVPTLLQFSLPNRLARNVSLLKGLLNTDDNVQSAIRGSAWLLAADLDKVLLPEMKTLEDYGVPTSVRLMILARHSKSLVDRSKRFQDIFGAVKRAGISPTSPIFAHAFGVLAKMNERSWEMKVENFKGLGWSEEQVTLAFAKHPYCMSVSMGKIAKNMEFFRDNFGWGPEYVSRNPVVLSFSFEKRVVPRWRVLRVLQGRGVLRGGVGSRHLMLGERVFLDKYVVKHQEQIPEVADDEVIKKKMDELGLLSPGNGHRQISNDSQRVQCKFL